MDRRAQELRQGLAQRRGQGLVQPAGAGARGLRSLEAPPLPQDGHLHDAGEQAHARAAASAAAPPRCSHGGRTEWTGAAERMRCILLRLLIHADNTDAALARIVSESLRRPYVQITSLWASPLVCVPRRESRSRA
eukprot:6186939-Pleurochrysis_carterae.AAC.1